MKKPLLYRSFGSKNWESDLGEEGDDENCLRAERETKFWEVGWSFCATSGSVELLTWQLATNRVVGAQGPPVGFVMLSERKTL